MSPREQLNCTESKIASLTMWIPVKHFLSVLLRSVHSEERAISL